MECYHIGIEETPILHQIWDTARLNKHNQAIFYK